MHEDRVHRTYKGDDTYPQREHTHCMDESLKYYVNLSQGLNTEHLEILGDLLRVLLDKDRTNTFNKKSRQP